MIAYYATRSENQGWSAAWAARALGQEIVTLRTSPLLELVCQHLPPPARVGMLLDAGCGMGAWVAVLMERGYRAVGVDAVQPVPSSLPIYQGKLANLWMLKDRDVDVYLSLGVIEHEQAGGDDILAEAARVLKPGGTLLLSVPYVNGLRRLLWWWIVVRQEWKHANGAAFYQWAFSQKELVSSLAAHGFTVHSTHPYGPTKMFRTWFRESTRDAYDAARPLDGIGESRWRRTVRRLLYTRSMLRLCGHMLLAVAVKK